MQFQKRDMKRNQKIYNTLKFILSILPLLFMMKLIWGFSAQNADTSGNLSNSLTVSVLNMIQEIFRTDWSMDQLLLLADLAEGYVRKAAHVTEYFLLAVTAAFPLFLHFGPLAAAGSPPQSNPVAASHSSLTTSPTNGHSSLITSPANSHSSLITSPTNDHSRKTSLTHRQILLLSTFFCAVFAALDEWHQYYVPGRYASPVDVLIDTAGSLLGAAAFTLLYRRCHASRRTK